MNDSRDDNCKDMRELLSAYHDAELDSSERAQVEEHLNGCADCREELAVVQSVVSSLKSLPTVSLSKDYSADIESLLKRAAAAAADSGERKTDEAVERKVEVLNERKADNVVSLTRKKPVGWIAAAAAAVIVLAVGSYLGTTGGGSSVVATKPDGGSQAVVATKDQTKDSSVSEKPLVAESNNSDASVPVEVTAAEKGTQSPEIAIKQDSPINPDTKESLSNAKTEPVKVATVKPTAPKQNRVIEYVDDLADNQALVAFSDQYDDNEFLDNSGISTDEDGLYAIKM
jgi:hypothetical protein